MTYPRELRENTYLKETDYPVNIFRNGGPGSRIGDIILHLHWHEHFELIVMERGAAVFHIESQAYEAAPGDVLIVPPGGLHVGYSSCEGEVVFYAIVFNPSLLGGLAVDPVHDRFLAPYLEGRLQFPAYLAHDDKRFDLCRRTLEATIREFETKSRAYELFVKIQLYQLFALLSRNFLPLGDNETVPGRKHGMDRFKRLILHVEKHYADKLTIEEAAKLVNLNPFHFCKVFKEATGRTFIDYVNAHRMNEAEKLLRLGDLTVTEVAEKVGCGNPNYFTRLFKQNKGITPSQLRSR